MSEYRLQIVFEDGSQVRFHPGAKSEEGALLTACVNQIVSKGVGLLKTETQVKRAIEIGLREVFTALKQGVHP